MVDPVMYDLAVEVAAELRNIFVVCIQYRNGARVKLLDELVLRACDVGDGRKKFQVDGSNIGHDANIRVGQLCECGNLTRMGHSEFDRRDLVLGLELQQLQWQSEVVVEVPFR